MSKLTGQSGAPGTSASTSTHDISAIIDSILPHHNNIPETNEKQPWLKGTFKDHRRCHPFRAATIALKSTNRLSASANILLPCIPIGIALHFALPDNYIAVFTVNYLAMIPSANMLAFASNELAMKMPKTVGATFETLMGAVVELIVCLILMLKGQISVVQAALLGSMLANLLLVSGACFVAGGVLYSHQELAEYVTETSGAGLLVSAIGLIIPSQFSQAVKLTDLVTDAELKDKVLMISRLISIGLFLSYTALLFFQLKTHQTVFDEALEIAEARNKHAHKEIKRDKLSFLEAFILLCLSLAFVTLCAIFLVEQIEHIVAGGHISDGFMGLILVPVVEKAAEHLIAINDAWNNQMDLALSHALGATIQTALLVAPVVVIVGWGAGRPMDLNFDYVWAFLLVLSVLVLGNFVRDRKTNWLEGGFLLMVYYGVAVAAWFFPNPLEPSESASATEGGKVFTTTAEAVATATAAAGVMLVRAMG